MRRAALLALLVLASCSRSRGFDRGSLSRLVRNDVPVVTDDEIAKALATRPQLPVPFQLAVHFQAAKVPKPYQGERQVPWAAEDRDAVLLPLEALVREGKLSKVIPVAEEVASGDDVKSIRLAAARYGADAVLVVRGAGDVDEYHNASAALYWTIAGMFFVPGTHVDALFVSSATLWDVRNEYLYASAQVEGIDRQRGPPIVVDEQRGLVRARGQAMKALGPEVEKRVRALTASAAATTRTQ